MFTRKILLLKTRKKYEITVITVIRCGYSGKCNHSQTSVAYYANSSCLTLKKVYANNRSLGPLLFLNFSYLLLKASPSLIYILFADDIIIFSIDPSMLKIEITNIEYWGVAIKQIIIYNQTIPVLFTAPNIRLDFNNFPLNFYNICLQKKSNTKFFGIILDFRGWGRRGNCKLYNGITR